MKRIFLLMLCVTFFIPVFAQDEKSYDVVLKLSGEEHIGNVIEMDDTSIKFVHKGESLRYTFKKADVMKITFSSGRIEIINEAPKKNADESNQGSSLEEHHNKIAILPFVYIIDKQSASEDMRYKVQTECYSYLNNHTGELAILDPITTNAMLIKAGINTDNIRGYTMGEICDILGVEYIITGTITQNETFTSNYQGSNTKVKSGDNKNNSGKTINARTSTYSSNTQKYQTAMTMNIYSNKNTNIYSKDHFSFWQTTDAYKITLQYLLKRTPIYKK
jgi:hypothetical protein